MSLGESIRKNTSWILGGNLTTRAFQFFVGVVLARILVPEDFGLLVTLQIFTGALGFIAGGGMGEALVQAKSVEENDFKVVFTAQLAICSLIYSALFIFAPFLSDWFNDQRYTDLLRVSALTFIIRPFANIPRAILRRNMQFKKITIIGLLTMVVEAAFSILLALKGFSTWSLIFGGLAGSLFTLFLLLYTTRWFPGFAYEKHSLQRLGGYGIKISINEIILHIRNQLPNLIISRTLGAGQVGLFNKADSTSQIPSAAISGSAYQTVFRTLSSIQTNLDQSKYIYFRTIALVCVYTFPFYVGLFWTAEPFILFIYGEKWSEAAMPLQILTIAGILNCISNPSGAVIAAQNRLGKEIQIQTETLVLFIVAASLGWHWGIIGVAVSLIPCHFYLVFRMAGLANRCIHGHHTDLFKALKPALVLNTILFILLFTIANAVPESFSTSYPGLFLLSMVASGGLAYAILFLMLPFRILRTEQERWKRLLMLKT